MGWLNAAAAARTPKYGKGIMGLWKQGWNEIPEVMGASFYGLIGVVGCLYVGCYRYYKLERYNHRYKTTYQVYRPEDERVCRIKKYEGSPEPTYMPAALKN